MENNNLKIGIIIFLILSMAPSISRAGGGGVETYTPPPETTVKVQSVQFNEINHFVEKDGTYSLTIKVNLGILQNPRTFQYSFFLKTSSGIKYELLKGQRIVQLNDVGLIAGSGGLLGESTVSFKLENLKFAVKDGDYTSFFETKDLFGSHEFPLPGSFRVYTSSAYGNPPNWMILQNDCQAAGSANNISSTFNTCKRVYSDYYVILGSSCCNPQALYLLKNFAQSTVPEDSEAWAELKNKNCIVNRSSDNRNLNSSSLIISPGWCSADYPQYMGVLSSTAGYDLRQKPLYFWMCCKEYVH
jgi:hypothetical protein